MSAKRVLVTDDAVVMRMMIKNILVKNGYEVFEAETGYDAVQKFKALRPDAVTLDMVMPELDGISALKEIIAEDADARVVMCTSMGHEALIVEAVQAGAKAFIVKPFQPPKILEAVEKALS